MNVPALKKMWVLDAQWTDCPPEVEHIIKAFWRQLELGNDNFMFRRSINELKDWELYSEDFVPAPELGENRHKWEKNPCPVEPLLNYLREKGVGDDEEVIFHWWW